MKALTLTQPWATLVAIGAKQIETRSWSTQYRGPLAIHAAKTMPGEAKEIASGVVAIYEALRAAGYTTRIEMKSYSCSREWLPAGAVIATCELVNCIRVREGDVGWWHGQRDHGHPIRLIRIPPEEPELSFGNYEAGRYAWILENIQPLAKPVPVKGALGLWEWDG